MLSVLLLVIVMAIVTHNDDGENAVQMLVEVKMSIKDINAMMMMMHADEMPYRLLRPSLHVLRLLFF